MVFWDKKIIYYFSTLYQNHNKYETKHKIKHIVTVNTYIWIVCTAGRNSMLRPARRSPHRVWRNNYINNFCTSHRFLLLLHLDKAIFVRCACRWNSIFKFLASERTFFSICFFVGTTDLLAAGYVLSHFWGSMYPPNSLAIITI